MKKLITRIFLLLGTVLLLIPAVLFVTFTLANKTNGQILSSGKKRKYLLYVPESYDPARPTPLVISIHGFSEWPAHQRDLSHWNQLADQYGFIVVYPCGTGLPLRWNISHFGGAGKVEQTQEVQFVADLIDHLQARYNIDPARIYANGMSNGGGMSFLLACRLSNRIAAIGGVAGAYLPSLSEYPQGRPVPTILFHGNADPIVPYLGGPSHQFNIAFPAIPEFAAELAMHNGCDPTPITLPGGEDFSGIAYRGASPDAEVIFYTINGGGHTWPGGKPLPEFITGRTTPNPDATTLMWEFFQRHPMP